MTTSKPTIVLVAGAWHTASTWDKLTPLLAARGHKCIPIGLPSASPDPSKTFLDDLTAVRAAIETEISENNNDVVVVAHSYGGIVGESAVKGLTEANNGARVMGLVLVATGFTPTGRSFMGSPHAMPPPSWRADEASGLAVLTADPRLLFYHDLPEDEGQAWAAKLTGQSLHALFEGGEHVYAGWMDVPAYYCVTAEDQALPPDVQRGQPGWAREAGARGVVVREIGSGHSPMLSRPEELADIIMEAAAAFDGME